MLESVIDPATPPKLAAAAPVTDPSLLAQAGKAAPAAPGSVLDDAAKQAQEAQKAEEERILAADPATLSDEDKTKRTGIEKAREDDRLLKADPATLSAEDKVKREALNAAATAAKAKATGVPEKYEIKVPGGMTVDQVFVDAITPVFKELKISQEGAQKLADIYAKRVQATQEAAAAEFKKFRQDSYAETVAALGAGYKEEIAYLAKVRDRFLSPETQELFEASGLGNVKSVVLDLINIGKLISEDKLSMGRPAGGEKSAAEIMYPNQPK